MFNRKKIKYSNSYFTKEYIFYQGKHWLDPVEIDKLLAAQHETLLLQTEEFKTLSRSYSILSSELEALKSHLTPSLEKTGFLIKVNAQLDEKNKKMQKRLSMLQSELKRFKEEFKMSPWWKM